MQMSKNDETEIGKLYMEKEDNICIIENIQEIISLKRKRFGVDYRDVHLNKQKNASRLAFI